MWKGEFEEVVEVFRAEPREGCQDENGFPIFNGVAGSGDVVEVIVYNWWRRLLCERLP